MTLQRKDPSEPFYPLVVSGELSNNTFSLKDEDNHLSFSGKGMKLIDAQISAIGEAIEVYSATNISQRQVTNSSLNKLQGAALDPRELVLYLPQQYKKLAFMPFTDNDIIGWVKGYSLVSEKKIYIPADSVFLEYYARNTGRNFFEITSSGLATGSTVLNAIIAGALEVIERDAFMITWYNKLPATRIDLKNYPDPGILGIVETYARRNVELQLYLLPGDAPCQVFMAIAVQKKGEGPCISVGLGADFSNTIAARKALMEVAQVRPYLKELLRYPATKERAKELTRFPDRIEFIEDHGIFYADKKRLAAFEFLFRQPATNIDWAGDNEMPAKSKINKLILFLKSVKGDLIYYNLTRCELEQSGLFTCRVIIPGFQPIHFGSHNLRMAGDRLYTLPVRLGLRVTKNTPRGLNANPHPFV